MNLTTQRLAISCLTNLGLYKQSGQSWTWTSRIRRHLIYSQDRYQLRVTCPFSAVHRIWTCKPFQANCFQDSSLTTRTYGKYLFYFIECDQWESNPYLQIHNLRYWPLYDSHSDPSGARTQHFRLERPVNWPFIRWDHIFSDGCGAWTQHLEIEGLLSWPFRRIRHLLSIHNNNIIHSTAKHVCYDYHIV